MGMGREIEEVSAQPLDNFIEGTQNPLEYLAGAALRSVSENSTRRGIL
jgi:hypothetical protein